MSFFEIQDQISPVANDWMSSETRMVTIFWARTETINGRTQVGSETTERWNQYSHARAHRPGGTRVGEEEPPFHAAAFAMIFPATDHRASR